LLNFLLIGHILLFSLNTGQNINPQLQFFLYYLITYLHIIVHLLTIEIFTAILYLFFHLTINGILELLQRFDAVDGAFAAEGVAGLLVIVEGDEGLVEVLFA
jgi:hypothetical protein